MYVTKRSGKTEKYNVAKIKESVRQACEGLDVSALALEAKFDEFLVEGITTKQLNKNLIHHAKTLAGPKTPDYVFVAGRFETMDRWADTGSYKQSFLKFVKKQLKADIWKHEGFSVYSDEQIEELGLEIVKERDLNHSYSSVLTALSKYLLPNECIQQMFMGNAMIIASVEEPETRIAFAKQVYHALSERKVSLATPWLGNLRSGGNISSCFIMAIEDNIDSIFDNLKDAAHISKNGGGLGVSFARMRCRGSMLMGQEGASGGMLGWNKLFNDTAVSVNQGGKRKGAFTTALPIWHGDIDVFLDAQSEHGDQRTKSHDVKPQVTVPDYFMVLKSDSSSVWHTFCPHEVLTELDIKLFDVFGKEFEAAYEKCVDAYNRKILKVVRTVNAKELWKKVMKTQFETGLPYIAFTCRINEMNPNKHVGNIYSVNLCTESFSVTVPDELQHTCNLASIVVGRVPLDEAEKYAALCTHILDNGITLTKPPTKASEAHNNLLRTIGVGVQGYADLVAREWVSYTNIPFAAAFYESLQMGCVREGVRLAKVRGAYPMFKGSSWDTGEQIGRYIGHSENRKEEWAELQSQVDEFGVRCSQFTSPAPNTTTSVFMDAAAGVMPVYGAFFYEDNADGLIPITSMFLKDNPISYMKDVTTFKPWELTAVMGEAQKWVDTGISAEYIMDKNQKGFCAKWLWDTLESAWTNKNKAVYYIRTVKEGEKLVKAASDCVGCDG